MRQIGKMALYALAILLMLGCVVMRLNAISAHDEARQSEAEQQQQEEEYIGACGNPLDGTTTIRFGVISEVKESSIVFLMDEGDLQEVEVGNPQDFDPDRYYCLFYQGDTVFKAWEEHW